MNRIYFGSGITGSKQPSRLLWQTGVAHEPPGRRDARRAHPKSEPLFPVQQPEESHPREKRRPGPHVQTRFHHRKADGRRHCLHPENRAKAEGIPSGQLGDGFILRQLELAIDRDQFDNGGSNRHDDRRRAAERRRRLPSAAASANRIAARTFSQAHEGLFVRGPERRGCQPHLEGAAIAIDSHTGGIRAIAAGRDYGQAVQSSCAGAAEDRLLDKTFRLRRRRSKTGCVRAIRGRRPIAP